MPKFKYAIENNTPDTLGKIFLNRNDFEAFLKMITSGKSEIEKYRNGKSLDNIEWPTASSIVQTFASADKDRNVTILFQLSYFYKQKDTRLFVDKVIYTSGAEIIDEATVLNKLKNQLNPPDAVDPYSKPLPPKPEENHVVH